MPSFIQSSFKSSSVAALALLLACTSTNKSTQNTTGTNSSPVVMAAPVPEQKAPEENRFTKVVLVDKLDEPMQLSVLDDGRIIFSGRKGKLKLYDPASKTTQVIGALPVYFENEDGLLGFTTDPNFLTNQHIYLYYAPVGSEEINQLSRFTLKNGELDLTTEKKMITVSTKRACCHSVRWLLGRAAICFYRWVMIPIRLNRRVITR